LKKPSSTRRSANRGGASRAAGGRTDIFTAEKRSVVMSKIQGGLAKNRLERSVHGWLKGNRVRHAMNPMAEGWPDVRVDSPGGPLFIFIDGCFWHMCPLHYTRPKSRQDFWIPHLEDSNTRRETKRARLSYRWLRVWEHEVEDGSYKEILKKAIAGA